VAITEGSAARPAARLRPPVWYRSWRFYVGLLLVILVYGCGWQVKNLWPWKLRRW